MGKGKAKGEETNRKLEEIMSDFPEKMGITVLAHGRLRFFISRGRERERERERER